MINMQIPGRYEETIIDQLESHLEHNHFQILSEKLELLNNPDDSEDYDIYLYFVNKYGSGPWPNTDSN